MKRHGTVAVTPGAGGTVNYDVANLTNATLEANAHLNTKKRYYADGLPPGGWTGAWWNGQLFVVDPAYPNVIVYSEDSLPEDMPPGNILTINPSPEDPNPVVVALRNNQDRLYAYTTRGAYEITGVAPLFKIYPAFAGIGTVSTTATRYIEGTGVVFPGYDKVYVHVGGADVRPLGPPKGNPGANALDDLYLASDFGLMREAVGIVDPETSSYRFTMPELGEAACDTAGVWEYSRNDWGEDTGRRATTYGRWSDVSGRERLVRGDDIGGVWQDELGNSEGYYDSAFSGTTASAARDRVTVTGLTASAVVPGTPCCILGTDGTVLYRNRVLSYAANILVMLYPWTVTTLSAINGKTLVIGTIEGLWKSGWPNISGFGYRGSIHSINPYLVRQSAGGTIRVLSSVNQSATWRVAAAAMSVNQHQDNVAFNDMGNQVAVQFDGLHPGTDWAVRGYAVVYTQKPSPR